MKNTIILFLLILTTACCCKSGDDNKPDEDNNFAQYFRCKVNGEDFQSTGDLTCEPLLFNYFPDSIFGTPQGYLVLRGRNCIDERRVGLRFREAVPQVGTFSLLQPMFADSALPYYSFEPEPGQMNRTVEKLVDGSVTFSRFESRTEEKLGTVEGTFSFTVIDTIDQTTYNITDGEFRFRIQHSW
ncbi:hypothetical protein G3O08_20590 [Cryomorpha ignava]|uniref:Uncharacterized protein n=1 Tax=Cryomorpha ignava TaxID=101383 RepID=A0A7K3WW77_9FLAO|nr:hypothetical protein [Cryomorpha ignava]NEN25893.1 hypothetical protein [Cryomorpha ignava]